MKRYLNSLGPNQLDELKTLQGGDKTHFLIVKSVGLTIVVVSGKRLDKKLAKYRIDLNPTYLKLYFRYLQIA
jgi:hypothetical protein